MKTTAPGAAAGMLLALVVVVLVSWALLGRGVALALARTSPELALRFHGGNPEALVRINESETDPVAKARRARLVLAQRPLDGRAYRQLAEIEEAAGRKGAAALFRVALRNTPRDRLAQAWMADEALARGAPAEAVARLMLMADMDATLWPALFPYLRQLSWRDGTRVALIDELATEPPWRSQFLSAWSQESPASFDAVMLALERQRASLTPAERELWVQHLIGAQRWTAAYLAWTSGLEATRLPTRAGVFNGGFEAAPAGRFDWVLAQGGGSRKDLLATSGAGGRRALRIQFTGRPAADMEQILVLPTGGHAFHARVRLDGLRSERGLVWSVRCVRDQALLGAGPTLRGSRDWHRYRFSFHVPEGCAAQRLTLELSPGNSIGRSIEGVAWFDDVAVEAVDEAPSAPDAVAADRHRSAAE
nr:hypothetical protein [Lysobacter sp.]